METNNTYILIKLTVVALDRKRTIKIVDFAYLLIKHISSYNLKQITNITKYNYGIHKISVVSEYYQNIKVKSTNVLVRFISNIIHSKVQDMMSKNS